MKKITVSLIAASMLFLGGCSTKIDNSPTVITVNGSKITRNMVDTTIKESGSMLGNLDEKTPQNKFFYLMFKARATNELVIKQLVNQEANKRKITVTDKDIDNKISELIEKVGGKEKFKTMLSTRGLTQDKLKALLKDDLLKDKLASNVLGVNSVNDMQVKDFYAKNKNTYFKHPDQVKASHILISASEMNLKQKYQTENKKISESELKSKVAADIKKSEQKAEKLLAEVKANPAKFEEIARKKSEDPSSAQNGGDLGFFTEKEMVPAFSKVAFSTKPGEISNLVKTEYGYHIIRVIDRKKAGVQPFDEVKELIKTYMENQNKMKALQKLIESARNTAVINYVDKNYDPKNIQKEMLELRNQQMSKKSQLMDKKPINNKK
jgi:parvulin-like peptidyl-prolyl isomerase